MDLSTTVVTNHHEKDKQDSPRISCPNVHVIPIIGSRTSHINDLVFGDSSAQNGTESARKVIKVGLDCGPLIQWKRVTSIDTGLSIVGCIADM